MASTAVSCQDACGWVSRLAGTGPAQRRRYLSSLCNQQAEMRQAAGVLPGRMPCDCDLIASTISRAGWLCLQTRLASALLGTRGQNGWQAASVNDQALLAMVLAGCGSAACHMQHDLPIPHLALIVGRRGEDGWRRAGVINKALLAAVLAGQGSAACCMRADCPHLARIVGRRSQDGWRRARSDDQALLAMVLAGQVPRLPERIPELVACQHSAAVSAEHLAGCMHEA